MRALRGRAPAAEAEDSRTEQRPASLKHVRRTAGRTLRACGRQPVGRAGRLLCGALVAPELVVAPGAPQRLSAVPSALVGTRGKEWGAWLPCCRTATAAGGGLLRAWGTACAVRRARRPVSWRIGGLEGGVGREGAARKRHAYDALRPWAPAGGSLSLGWCASLTDSSCTTWAAPSARACEGLQCVVANSWWVIVDCRRITSGLPAARGGTTRHPPRRQASLRASTILLLLLVSRSALRSRSRWFAMCLAEHGPGTCAACDARAR